MREIYKFFTKTRPLLLTVPWIGWMLQAAFFPEPKNLLYAFIAAAISTLIILDTCHPHRWIRYPISTLILCGFAFTQALGPLIFTVLDIRPIIFNLKVPEEFFINSSACACVLLFAHFIYRHKILQNIRYKITNFLDGRINFFQPLLRIQAITLGVIGLLSMVYVYWFNRGEGTFIIKFIQGFLPFANMPLILLLKPLQNSSKFIRRKDLIINVVFLVLIFIAALGRNSRSAFAVPMTTYAIGLFFLLIYQKIKFRLKYIIITLVLTFFLLPIFSNLATAMVMARVLRGDIPATELIYETLVLLQDPEKIEVYKNSVSEVSSSGWDESYLSNPYLSRFVNLKFADNALDLESQLNTTERSEFQQFTFGRILAIFPDPVLNIFGFPSDLKQKVTTVGWGDMLLYLATGNSSVLGGFRVSHYYGTGLAAFGWFYLPILGVLAIAVFILQDALVSIPKNNTSQSYPVFSSLALSNLYDSFVQLNASSLVDLISFMTRNWLQQVIFYAIFLRLTLLLMKTFNQNVE